jgi:hypothetical protein
MAPTGLEERTRLSGPGLRTFLNVALRWRLCEEEQVRLLRATSENEFRHWVEAAQAQQSLTLETDVLMRISAVLGLLGDLQQIIATVDEEHRWLRGTNNAVPFLGRAPIEVLLNGTLENLLDVRRYVLALGQGYHAPNEADRDFRPYTDDDIQWQ